jgi:hypothetical protein
MNILGRVSKSTKAERLCVKPTASQFDVSAQLITPCRSSVSGPIVGKCVYATPAKSVNPAGRNIDAVLGVCTES